MLQLLYRLAMVVHVSRMRTGEARSAMAAIAGSWSMPSVPISILPGRWATATEDMPAIRLVSKGSRKSAADLGMPSNSTRSSRCTTQFAVGMSTWSRSQKLSE